MASSTGRRIKFKLILMGLTTLNYTYILNIYENDFTLFYTERGGGGGGGGGRKSALIFSTAQNFFHTKYYPLYFTTFPEICLRKCSNIFKGGFFFHDKVFKSLFV